MCKRLQAFDVHYLMTMDGTAMDCKTKAGLKEQQIRTYKLFGEMGSYCRDTYGIEVLMHPERRSLIETREELERLIDLDLCICFDNGHYAAANGNWKQGDRSALDFLEAHIDHIPYLHFKMYLVRSERWRWRVLWHQMIPGWMILCAIWRMGSLITKLTGICWIV